MKLSLQWIKQYVALPEDLTTEQLSYDLTMRTVEVESAVNLADNLKGVVVGTILEILPHPQADKLRICMVDIGKQEPSTIVCGGSNIATGMKVVVAAPGAMVRWHGEGEPVEIKPTKLRGVLSEGMICAASELDLDALFPAKDEREIMDISSFDCRNGDTISNVLGLGDIILEIDNKSLTNRPDLWGHYGIARELAAIYQAPLKELPKFTLPEGLDSYPVEIQAPDRCGRYCAMVYEGIENKPSPYPLQLALWKCGLRPINAPVDLTNYIMLSVGQPTHGFDLNLVEGGIVVRKAQPNEQLTLLDGSELKLTTEDLVIANHQEAMALAGIMGGEKDSIGDETKAMLLEIANFNPLYIRRTATRFQIHTDSAIRNEKGLDSQRVDEAMAVGHHMICELFPQAKLVAFGNQAPAQTKRNEITVSLSWLEKRLGQKVDYNQIISLLSPLGFQVKKKDDDHIVVLVPSWRSTGDVSLPDDILEEVARMIGYENFEFIAPKVALNKAIKQDDFDLERTLREYLAKSCGMQEIFSYPWVDEKYIQAAGFDIQSCLALSDPPSPETAHLRPSLIPAVLEGIETNHKFFDSFAFFEKAQVFLKGETHPSEVTEILPVMPNMLAGAIVGKSPETVFRQLKGILEKLDRETMIESCSFKQEKKPTWADRNAWLNFMQGDIMLGSLGILSPVACSQSGIKHVYAAAFEINVDLIKTLPSRSNSYETLPQFPLVEQDFSMLFDKDVPWALIEETIRKNVYRLEFIEEYHGDRVPEGKKSLTFRVWYRSDEGTLTSGQIAERSDSIIKKLTRRLGGQI